MKIDIEEIKDSMVVNDAFDAACEDVTGAGLDELKFYEYLESRTTLGYEDKWNFEEDPEENPEDKVEIKITQFFRLGMQLGSAKKVNPNTNVFAFGTQGGDEDWAFFEIGTEKQVADVIELLASRFISENSSNQSLKIIDESFGH